ncbi:phosphate ABC transporter substrate-binding protein [Halomonas sp. M5N1S17]|uniref:phosphate ABC transporter substrate-binding protein n=1 Tax=Halomonas alkalisoli TaxID=2907158 RepID=UPI001F4494A4|nr:phosphate ABC transporter substrate-binding protein [Halomonas alkalisoli]MCE9665629.1 phosphate ABC transporter substrate-binding protein [Halomonas alkalisoli]
MRLTSIVLGLFLSFIVGTASAEVVVVVSVQNPIESLSRAQLTDIYLGRLNRFPHGGAVTPMDQREGTTAHSTFYRDYLGQSPAQIKAHWSKLIFTGRGQPPRSVAGDSAMADTVAASPDVIGYLDSTYLGSVDEGDRLRVVAIE